MQSHTRRACLKIFSAVSATMLLTGCEFDINRYFYPATTKAFAACLESAKKQATVQDGTAREYCSSKHSMLVGASMSGEGNYWRAPAGLRFVGRVDNNSSEFVITSYTIYISRKDRPEIFRQTFSNEWIEPGRRSNFMIYDLKLENVRDLNIQSGSFNWGIESVRGLRIYL